MAWTSRAGIEGPMPILLILAAQTLHVVCCLHVPFKTTCIFLINSEVCVEISCDLRQYNPDLGLTLGSWSRGFFADLQGRASVYVT